MTFGELLKKLRQDKQLSQPALADVAGIEQSYLSKLENDKSLPSNDIFRQLLTALEIDLNEFVQHFDDKYLRNKLKQISDIEHWLLKHQQQSLAQSRKWLVVSSLLIILGATSFFTGQYQYLFSEKSYIYESKGITYPGEPVDLLEGGWMRIVSPSFSSQEEIQQMRKKVANRTSLQQIVIQQHRGNSFVQTEGDASRYYLRKDTFSNKRIENSILRIAGIALFIAGIMGFILEYRLSKRQ